MSMFGERLISVSVPTFRVKMAFCKNNEQPMLTLDKLLTVYTTTFLQTIYHENKLRYRA